MPTREWNLSSAEYDYMKSTLHAYLRVNTFMDKHIVIVYKGNAWQFDPVYNDSQNMYRIIQILDRK